MHGFCCGRRTGYVGFRHFIQSYLLFSFSDILCELLGAEYYPDAGQGGTRLPSAEGDRIDVGLLLQAEQSMPLGSGKRLKDLAFGEMGVLRIRSPVDPVTKPVCIALAAHLPAYALHCLGQMAISAGWEEVAECGSQDVSCAVQKGFQKQRVIGQRFVLFEMKGIFQLPCLVFHFKAQLSDGMRTVAVGRMPVFLQLMGLGIERHRPKAVVSRQIIGISVTDLFGASGIVKARIGLLIAARDAGLMCQLDVGERVLHMGIHAEIHPGEREGWCWAELCMLQDSAQIVVQRCNVFIEGKEQCCPLRTSVEQGVEIDVEFEVSTGLCGTECDGDALIDKGRKYRFVAHVFICVRMTVYSKLI